MWLEGGLVEEVAGSRRAVRNAAARGGCPAARGRPTPPTPLTRTHPPLSHPILSAGPDARSVAGPPGPGAARNIALAAGAGELHRSLHALLPRAPPGAEGALVGPLDALQAAAARGVAPLFRDAAERAGVALARCHGSAAAYATAEPPPDASPSAWAAEAAAGLAHFR